MINGDFVGEPDTCFIGVYSYDDKENTNMYYFGSPFFREFYVSLSAELLEQDKQNGQLKVAFGAICPTAYLGDIVYNKDYEFYQVLLTSSASHVY